MIGRCRGQAAILCEALWHKKPCISAFPSLHTCFLTHGFCSHIFSFGLHWSDSYPISMCFGVRFWQITQSLTILLPHFKRGVWLTQLYSENCSRKTIVWEVNGGSRLHATVMAAFAKLGREQLPEREILGGGRNPKLCDCSFHDQNLLGLFISHSFCVLLPFILHILFFYIFFFMFDKQPSPDHGLYFPITFP